MAASQAERPFHAHPLTDQVSPSPFCRWAFLELHTNGRFNDSLQAYAAGVVEAAVSEEVRAWSVGEPGTPPTQQLCSLGSFGGV